MGRLQADTFPTLHLTAHLFANDFQHKQLEREDMSGKVKQRTAANQDSHTLSINERILKECHTLYIDPENGKTSCELLNTQ